MNFLLDWLGLNNLNFNELLWVSFGTLGQLIFFSRWVIQWYYSEKFNYHSNIWLKENSI